MSTELNLVVNNIIYSGWLTVDINLSIESLSGVFTLTLTDKWLASGDNPAIQPGDQCALIIDGTTVITGYVDRVMPGFTEKSHTVTVTGRDKAGDLVDCSITGSNTQFKNLLIEKIITTLCTPFGVSVKADVTTGDIVVNFAYEQGMSVFEGIQKLCKMRQCLALSDGEGGLLITRAGTQTQEVSLVEQENILALTAEYDYSVRYSEYIVKGQQQAANLLGTDSVSGNVAYSYDTAISRHRPLIVIADGPATIKNCQQRADWENSTRRGKSKRYTVTVAGWRQTTTGKLWALNQTVTLKSPLVGVYDNLLIAQVNFKLDEGGEITVLQLTSPDSYLTFAVDPLTTDQYLTSSNTGT